MVAATIENQPDRSTRSLASGGAQGGWGMAVRRFWVCSAAAVLVIATMEVSPAVADDTSYGQQVYRKANCMGCHKWHGAGGGGYGGAALSLRATQLTREQMIEVVTCGRPGTNMPYHASDAYTAANPCYGGMDKESLGHEAPPFAAQFLSARQIEGVVDYVLADVKGRGEPTKQECAAFWGAQSHECTSMP